MSEPVKKAVLLLLLIGGALTAVAGVALAALSGPEGQVEYTYTSSTTHPVMIDDTVLRSGEGAEATVRVSTEPAGEIWVGQATKEDADALAKASPMDQRDGLSFFDRTLSGEVTSQGKPAAVAQGYIWRHQWTVSGDTPIQFTPSDAPQSLVVFPVKKQGTVLAADARTVSVAVEWANPAWFWRPLIWAAAGAVVFLLALMWRRRLSSSGSGARAGRGGNRHARRTRTKAEPDTPSRPTFEEDGSRNPASTPPSSGWEPGEPPSGAQPRQRPEHPSGPHTEVHRQPPGWGSSPPPPQGDQRPSTYPPHHGGPSRPEPSAPDAPTPSPGYRGAPPQQPPPPPPGYRPPPRSSHENAGESPSSSQRSEDAPELDHAPPSYQGLRMDLPTGPIGPMEEPPSTTRLTATSQREPSSTHRHDDAEPASRGRSWLPRGRRQRQVDEDQGGLTISIPSRRPGAPHDPLSGSIPSTQLGGPPWGDTAYTPPPQGADATTRTAPAGRGQGDPHSEMPSDESTDQTGPSGASRPK